LTVGILGHNPGQQGHIIAVQHVSNSIYCDGKYSGIAEYYFIITGSCRITMDSIMPDKVDVINQQVYS